MNECSHAALFRGMVGEVVFWYCDVCDTKFTIKPFEIRVTYPEPVERQEGEKGL